MLTGMITATAAICPFAKSTLETMRTFIISGDHPLEKQKIGDSGTFPLRCGGNTVQAFDIHGHGVHFPEIAIGRRYLGDAYCWVLKHESFESQG
jgi:hypothetical protein